MRKLDEEMVVTITLTINRRTRDFKWVTSGHETPEDLGLVYDSLEATLYKAREEAMLNKGPGKVESVH